MTPHVIPLVGKRFGKWSVLARHPENYRRTFVQWLCRCDCGTERVVLGNHLRGGTSASCGCVQKEKLVQRNTKHDMTDAPGYVNWKHMKQRCQNPRNKNYAYYGGRGITVCDHWQSFDNFIRDMGPPPEGLTLDRIDVNGNYEPGNCRWADRKTQTANRRISR